MTDKKIVLNSFLLYIQLLKSAAKYKLFFCISLMGIIVIAITDALLVGKINPQIIDEGFVNQDPKMLWLGPILIIGVFAIRGFAEFIRVYFMGIVGRSVVRDYRRKMLSHIMLLPASFFDRTSQGSLLSKINYDAEQVGVAISDSLSEALRGIFIAVSQLSVMFIISWEVSLLVLIAFPLLSIYFKYISKVMRRYSTKMQTTMGDVTHVAGEIIEGYKVIKSFNGEQYEQNRAYMVTESNKTQSLKMCFAAAISTPIMQLLGAFVFALIVFCVLKFLTFLTVGKVLGFMTAMIQLQRPIKQISAVNSNLQKGIAAADSILTLLQEKPEDNYGCKKINNLLGKIEFKNVYFKYSNLEDVKSEFENNTWILENINFTISPGTTVALVGGSGGGKSSLISLLPRFYNINRGKILIDDIDINELELSNLRSLFSIVTQNVTLFNDTIFNNIAYAALNLNNHITEENVIYAAKAAHAFEFIEKLPDGLQTMVGDNGVLLSGGQRQRIAIARAILKDSPILILDEATSAVDPISESLIKKALDRLRKRKTTLVIAHRLSTIENADQIIVIDNGKIIEKGTHQELLSNYDSHYSALQRVYSE